MTTHFRIELSVDVAINDASSIVDELRWFDKQFTDCNRFRKKNVLKLSMSAITRASKPVKKVKRKVKRVVKKRPLQAQSEIAKSKRKKV